MYIHGSTRRTHEPQKRIVVNSTSSLWVGLRPSRSSTTFKLIAWQKPIVFKPKYTLLVKSWVLRSNCYCLKIDHSARIVLCSQVLTGYILVGAIPFWKWESWSYLDSVYFCFTSVLKIGFGDFVAGAGYEQDSRAGKYGKLVCNYQSTSWKKNRHLPLISGDELCLCPWRFKSGSHVLPSNARSGEG